MHCGRSLPHSRPNAPGHVLPARRDGGGARTSWDDGRAGQHARPPTGRSRPQAAHRRARAKLKSTSGSESRRRRARSRRSSVHDLRGSGDSIVADLPPHIASSPSYRLPRLCAPARPGIVHRVIVRVRAVRRGHYLLLYDIDAINACARCPSCSAQLSPWGSRSCTCGARASDPDPRRSRSRP